MSIPKQLAKKVLSPVTSKSDQVLSELVTLIHAIKNDLSAQIVNSHEALSEELGAQGRRLVELSTSVDTANASAKNSASELSALREETNDQLVALREELSWARSEIRMLKEGTIPFDSEPALKNVTQSAAEFLNFAGSHRGPLADISLWMNDPLTIGWSEGAAELGSVNERIIEQPFTLSKIAEMPPGSRVIDIGGGESTIGFSLASLGYDVTVLEPAGYPFVHPNLEVNETYLEDHKPSEPYDAAILLSAIEHFGIGHYGLEEADDSDIDALRLLLELVRPGGRLVLTTPYGPAAVTEVERIYDRERLTNLLAGWNVESVSIGKRTSNLVWEVVASEMIDPAPEGCVAMVVATRP